VHITELTLAARSQGRHWAVSRGRVESDAGGISLEGEGDDERMERLELRAQDLRLAKLEPFAPGLAPLTGSVRLEAKAFGPWGDPQVQARVEGDDLRIAGEALDPSRAVRRRRRDPRARARQLRNRP
jgi:hypothetical protein